MEEGWEDLGTGFGEEPAGATVVYQGSQSQREADAIFARLKAWRDRGRKI